MVASPKPEQQFDKKLLAQLSAVNAYIWATSGGLKVDGQLFDTSRRLYQQEWVVTKARKTCLKSGTQMGKTIAKALRKLHHLIYGYFPKGAMYVFPTAKAVQKFSQTRLNPLLEDNPHLIGRFISQDANNLEVKRVAKSKLLFVGATSTSTIGGLKKDAMALRSEPADSMSFDEVDLMDPDMVFLALQRMSDSEIKEEEYVSTPSIPDFGIDKLYNESDQCLWMIPCPKCGKETCLETEFPECLHERPNGDVVRQCIHCHDAELDPRYGRWVPQCPDRTENMVGWWISQLNSMVMRPKDILKLYRDPPNGNIAEVYNSVLAMAYIATENRLKQSDVLACCGQDLMAGYWNETTAMGVDVGAKLNVVIGKKLSEKQYRILKLAELSTFNDVHDLAKRFNVKVAVFDLYPETRKVRDFGMVEPYAVYGCDYSEHQRGTYNWNELDRTVTVNRTEICDSSHELVVNPGRLELPRTSKEVREYARGMCNIAKVLQEDDETGSKRYFYRKLGADHWRHATNYFMLAAGKMGASRGARKRGGKPKQVCALGWT